MVRCHLEGGVSLHAEAWHTTRGYVSRLLPVLPIRGYFAGCLSRVVQVRVAYKHNKTRNLCGFVGFLTNGTLQVLLLNSLRRKPHVEGISPRARSSLFAPERKASSAPRPCNSAVLTGAMEMKKAADEPPQSEKFHTFSY